MSRRFPAGCRGATLVELLVCLALLGLFTATAVALVRPVAALYSRMQSRSRAWMIADTLADALQADLLYAEGTLRLAEAAESEGEAARPFRPVQTPPGETPAGTAVEFRRGGAYLLLDAGVTPETLVPDPDGGEGWTRRAAQPAGRLHKRYYRVRSEPAEGQSGTFYQYRLGGETGAAYTADACTDAFPAAFYLGSEVSLRFSVHSTVTDGEGVLRVTALAAEITVRQAQTGRILCTRRTVLDLPGCPALLQDPALVPGRDGAAP